MQNLHSINRLLVGFTMLCMVVILIHISISSSSNHHDDVKLTKISKHSIKISHIKADQLVIAKPKREFSKKIFFLKTHKTGSSSIYNILARLSLTYDLTPLLLYANGKESRHIWPARFDQKYYYMPKDKDVDNLSKVFDIYMEHIRFQREKCSLLFPKQSSYYFTIMRDPVTAWRSSFEYFRLAKLFGVHNSPTPIKTFFDKKFENRLIKWSSKIDLVQLLLNALLFDLGYNREDMYQANLDNIIKELERDFDFVMIMEYFDEGLIVLKNALHLSYTDIVTFNMNESYGTKKETLTDEIKNRINALNYADRYVYDYFRRKFEQTYLTDPAIIKDTNTLRQYRKNIFDACVSKRTPKFAYGSVYYYGYVLKTPLEANLQSLCQHIIYSELEIKSILANGTQVKFNIPRK